MYCWKTKPIVKKQYLLFIFCLGQLCESCPWSLVHQTLLELTSRVGWGVEKGIRRSIRSKKMDPAGRGFFRGQGLFDERMRGAWVMEIGSPEGGI